MKTASGAIDLRDGVVQWPGMWTGFTYRDNGGFFYLTDGRCIERWPAESSEHAMRRNGQDWRPVVICEALMAEREVGRDKVGIERTTTGQVVVTIKPKDFATDGASEAALDRSRGDDGSVTIVITPRDGAPSTIDRDAGE